eukprot:12409099-Karenia_brevis.AAC.1
MHADLAERLLEAGETPGALGGNLTPIPGGTPTPGGIENGSASNNHHHGGQEHSRSRSRSRPAANGASSHNGGEGAINPTPVDLNTMMMQMSVLMSNMMSLMQAQQNNNAGPAAQPSSGPQSTTTTTTAREKKKELHPSVLEGIKKVGNEHVKHMVKIAHTKKRISKLDDEIKLLIDKTDKHVGDVILAPELAELDQPLPSAQS